MAGRLVGLVMMAGPVTMADDLVAGLVTGRPATDGPVTLKTGRPSPRARPADGLGHRPGGLLSKYSGRRGRPLSKYS
jgi:hypothetical protein